MLLASVGVLTGCWSSANSPLPPRLERIRPTDPPPTSFTPQPGVPLDFRVLKGQHFQLAVPSGWTDRTLASKVDKGIPGVLASASGTEPGMPVDVAVVIDTRPRSDAIEQSQVLAVAKSTQGVTDVSRSLVPWPRTQRSVLVSWTQAQPGTGTLFHTVQLMAQVSPELIVNVVAVAPAATFSSSSLDRVIRTLTVSP